MLIKQRFVTQLVAIVESLGLTSAILVLGYYFKPADPFLMHDAFPWIWLAPVLISLRYGSRFGLLALGAVIGAIFYVIYFSKIDLPASYPIFLLGGITLTLACCKYRDAWSKKQNYLQQQNIYFKESIERLSREHSVLRFSHTRLEQSLITKPVTLREALQNVNQLLQDAKSIVTKACADRFLHILAHYTSLERAALFLNRNDVIDTHPFAQIGVNKTLAVDDQLVQRALKVQQTTYFAVSELSPKEKSEYLAVAPLLCSDGSLLGLLTISDMPFLLLQNETLRELTVLLAYFSDQVWASQQAITLQDKYPDCPAQFAAELFKMEHLWRDIKVDSALMVFYLYPDPEREALIFELLSTRRDLDCAWRTHNQQCEILIILMPLANFSMTKGCLDRINEILKRFPHSTPETGLVEIRNWQLSSYPHVIRLIDLVLKQ